MRADLHAPPRRIGETVRVEQAERDRAVRPVPLVGAPDAIRHGKGDGGDRALLEQRKRPRGEIPVAVVEGQQQRAAWQPAAPFEKAHELLRRHEPIAGPAQRVELQPEPVHRNAVRLQQRIAREIGDRVIAEHAQRMRTGNPSPTVHAPPVLHRAQREQEGCREAVGMAAIHA